MIWQPLNIKFKARLLNDKFPWKKVKKGDKQPIKNLCPVSRLPISGNVSEPCFLTLCSYFLRNNLLFFQITLGLDQEVLALISFLLLILNF